MASKFFLTVLIGFVVWNLQAQQTINMQSVYDAKKRIIQQLNANNTRCTWDYYLYKEKKVGGKTGLYTFDGKQIIPPVFQEILGPPYSWLVLTKKFDSDKYSLYNLAGNQLAESAYYSVFRIPNNVCAVAGINESDEACKDETYTFSLNYLCSYYLVTNSLHMKGIINSDNEILLPFEFSKITHAGGSRFITSSNEKRTSYDLFDVETQKTLLKNVEAIKVFFINKSKPIYTGRSIYQDRASFYAVKENKKWRLLNADLSNTLPKVYDEINIKDAFVIARDNQLYDIYKASGNLLIKELPHRITDVINSPKGFVFVTEEIQDYTYRYTLFNSKKEELLRWENGRFLTNRNEFYAFATMVVNKLPEKSILAFISIDEKNGIFLFEDLSYEVVEREE